MASPGTRAQQPIIRPASPADAPAIARVHVNSWRSTYRGIVPDSVLENLDYAGREKMWRRGIEDTMTRQFVFVAQQNDVVIGFVAGGPERTGEYPEYTGEIYAIYVDDSHQGQGAGRTLFETGVRALIDQDHHSMLIWALSENPACHFYRRFGGHPIATQNVTMGQKRLEETAFGWKNISMVLNSSESGE